jgi:hypothetical protein
MSTSTGSFVPPKLIYGFEESNGTRGRMPLNLKMDEWKIEGRIDPKEMVQK